jgi:hypothetical protein
MFPLTKARASRLARGTAGDQPAEAVKEKWTCLICSSDRIRYNVDV